MNNVIVNLIIIVLVILACVIAPGALIWGWISWVRNPHPRTFNAQAALLSFVLATASALFAIGSFLYSVKIGGFGFYDPRLLRILRWGFLLSLAGVLAAVAGVWRKSPLRWLALCSAIGTLSFWICVAEGE